MRFILSLSLLVLMSSFLQAQTLKKSILLDQAVSFEENKGQLADDKGSALTEVKYFTVCGNTRLYFLKDRVKFLFIKSDTTQRGKFHTGPVLFTTQRIELQFKNINPAVQLIGSDELSSQTTYYLAHCTKGLSSNKYNKITYKNIYQGIDLVFTAKGNGMEYSFIVHPHADVNAIAMHWEGAENISSGEDNAITYKTSLGYIKEVGLKSFLAEGQKKINVSYKIKETDLAFNVPAYDKSQTLIIDPVLSWSTYFAGNCTSIIRGISTDASGNVYVTGQTTSTSGLATSGTYQTSGGGDYDAFVSKLSAKGNVIWSTYFGSQYSDIGNALVLDRKGSVLICGQTQNQSGIATSGTYQTSFGGGYDDAFAAKFTSTGKLTWATYYGGSLYDYGYGIAADTSGNVYMVGGTTSDTGIASKGAYLTSQGGYFDDAFIVKFDATGKRLWGTYFGGSGTDDAYGVMTNDSGNVYVTGTTSSTGLATSGSYKSIKSKLDDVFLAKFSPTGSLNWSTYYGGDGEDRCNGIALSSAGNVLIAGSTGTTGLATSGVYQTSQAGGMDAFISEFSTSGNHNWTTYYGGDNDETNTGIATNGYGNIFICGYTISKKGIASSGASQSIYGGGYFDGYFAEFSSTGSGLWSTYFGGNNTEGNCVVAADDLGDVYLAGSTTSTKGIATASASDTSYTGVSGEAYLAKFNFKTYANEAGINSIRSPKGVFCAGLSPVKVRLQNFGYSELDSVIIGWRVNGKKQSPFKWYGRLSAGATIDTIIGTFDFQAGKNTVSAMTYSPNGATDSVPQNDSSYVIDTVNALPAAYTGGNHSICPGGSVTLGASAISGHTYSWTSRPLGFTSSVSNPNVKPAVTTKYYLTEKNSATGCSKTDSATITIYPLPGKNAGNDQSVCKGDSVIIGKATTPGYTYTWSSYPSGFISAVSNPVVSPSVTTSYYLKETSATGCSNTDTVVVTVNPLPAANAGGNHSICNGSGIQLGAASVSGHTYSWTSNPAGFSSTASNPTVTPSVQTTYYITETNTVTGCSNKDSAVITVNQKPAIPDVLHFTACANSTQEFHATVSNGYTYRWFIKGGKILTNLLKDSVAAVWDKPGSYSISVEVTNASGCKDTTNFLGTILPLPNARFHVKTTDSLYTFTPEDTLLSVYKWTFGDGSPSSTNRSVSHVFPKNRSYTVSLMTNDSHCTQTFDTTLNVLSSDIAENADGALQAVGIYPNPFTSVTTIHYSLEKSSQVDIDILDIQGRKIASIVNGNQLSGEHTYSFDALQCHCPAGIYLVKIMISDQLSVRRIIRVE
jgi:hypothetical protein